MVTLVPAEYVGRFSCPACPLRFATLTLKKQHLKTKHPRKAKG